MNHIQPDATLPTHMIHMDVRGRRGLFLRLWHGRVDPEADMDDWGTECPHILGPFDSINFTYDTATAVSYGDSKCFRLDENFTADFVPALPPNTLAAVDDMLYFNGVFYGDWQFFAG